MRLDHLLSKEHWRLLARPVLPVGGGSGVQVAPSQAIVLWGLLTGGTSISWRRHLVPAHQYWPLVFVMSGSWTVGGVGVGVPGTLLGPEGPGASSFPS